jgi:hypothetical protein
MSAAEPSETPAAEQRPQTSGAQPKHTPRPPASRPTTSQSAERNKELELQSRKRFEEMKEKFEKIIEGQQHEMKDHLKRATSAKENSVKRLAERNAQWKAKASQCLRTVSAKGETKLKEVSESVKEEDKLLMTARELAEDHYSTLQSKRARHRSENYRRAKELNQQAEAFLADYCSQQHFYLPPPPSAGGKTPRQLSPEASNRLLKPLEQQNERLPLLLMSREQARNLALEKASRDKSRESQRRKQHSEEHQEVVRQRVHTILERTLNKYISNLRKKEAACERVSRLMEERKNPRRAEAINRLLKTNPELWD